MVGASEGEEWADQKGHTSGRRHILPTRHHPCDESIGVIAQKRWGPGREGSYMLCESVDSSVWLMKCPCNRAPFNSR